MRTLCARVRRVRGESGTSVVEFALVAGLLLMILFAIVQFGIAYHITQGLQAAAREGSRVASLPGTTSAEIRDRVRASLSGIDPSAEACPPAVGQYCVSITPSAAQPCNLRSGQSVTVEVAGRVRIDIPLWASPEVGLTGKGVFRCE